VVAATVLAGCRTPAPVAPPTAPSDATTLTLTDDEMPRVLYASAWGAFAEFGWDIVDHDPAAMRFVARPEGMDGEAEVAIETNSARAIARRGRIVVSVDPAQPEAREVLLGAARALATVPGHLSFR
jgi:hypothetical protein